MFLRKKIPNNHNHEDKKNTEAMEEIGTQQIPPNEAARPFRTNGPDGRGDRGRSPRFT
jgi:hypothetical protein